MKYSQRMMPFLFRHALKFDIFEIRILRLVEFFLFYCFCDLCIDWHLAKDRQSQVCRDLIDVALAEDTDLLAAVRTF